MKLSDANPLTSSSTVDIVDHLLQVLGTDCVAGLVEGLRIYASDNDSPLGGRAIRANDDRSDASITRNDAWGARLPGPGLNVDYDVLDPDSARIQQNARTDLSTVSGEYESPVIRVGIAEHVN